MILKNKKLNTSGLGHHALIALMVISGIAGFGAWRVYSSSAATYGNLPIARCTINAPATIKAGSTYSPSVTIVNTGKVTFTPYIKYDVLHSNWTTSNSATLQRLAPGSKVTKSLGSYKVYNAGYGDNTATVRGVTTASFSCSKKTDVIN